MGAIEATQAAAFQNQQMRSQQLQAQLLQSAGMQGVIGDNGEYMNADGTPINWKQVGLSTAGDPGVWRNIALFAGGGALAGGSAGLGIGAIPGAAIGAAIGVGVAIRSNVKSQKTDTMAAQKIVLTQGQTNLNRLILLMQADPANAPLYIDGYNQQMNKIAEAYSNLKADASNNLNLIVEQDGTTQLARFEAFYSPGGARDYYNQKMQLAIAAPNAQQALTELAISQQNIEGENELQ